MNCLLTFFNTIKFIQFSKRLKYFTIFLLLGIVAGFNAQTTLNAYANITAISGNSVLSLASVDISNHTFTVGGQVIVMQMQDDVVGTNTTNASTFGDIANIKSAGLFEIKTIAAITPTSGTPTSLTLTSVLSNTYNFGTNSNVQLISFRDLGANYTTSANISGKAWNGTTGGVVAFVVTNTLTLNHRILADGIGFRGGAVSSNAGGDLTCVNTSYISTLATLGKKGEGIYATSTTSFTQGRGKIANGGGGGSENNAGGGGGANYTAGGIGGLGYPCTTGNSGRGLGGVSLSASITTSRIFMGGGGGGGQANNGNASAGGNGGGIILIKAKTIATSASCSSSIQISANGVSATNSGNDGSGGGGAGGSIVIQATTFSITASCQLTVSSNAGNGGSVTDPASHGGGGGGGQGVVAYSTAQPTLNVTTQVNNGTAGSDNSGGTTNAGAGGGSSGTGTIVASSGPLPIKLVYFEGYALQNNIKLIWQTATEKNNKEFVIEKSTNALDYTFLGSVKGAGNSDVLRHYDLTDYYPIYGINYYRLKQIDFDGTTTIAPLVAIEFKEPGKFIVYPNPLNTSQDLMVELSQSENQKVQIKIEDFTGKVLYENEFMNAETQIFSIKNLNLERGLYQISVRVGDFSTNTQKLLVR